MDNKTQLRDRVAASRNSYLNLVRTVSEQQAQWKPAPDVWNLVEITEHLFWAEQGAIFGMWKTLHAIRQDEMPRKTESEHQNMPIETLIALTWQEKEQVPAVAAPRIGGSIAMWIKALDSLQDLLESFVDTLHDDDLRVQAHPHPISGAMDFQQRIEFLSFHIDRHRAQATGLTAQFDPIKNAKR